MSVLDNKKWKKFCKKNMKNSISTWIYWGYSASFWTIICIPNPFNLPWLHEAVIYAIIFPSLDDSENLSEKKDWS